VNGIKSKFDELKQFLSTHNIGVFGVSESESKLFNDDDNKFFTVDFYTTILDRRRDGGGLIMYISKSIKFTIVTFPFDLPNELEVLIIRAVHPGVKPILYVLIYNPPNHVN